MTVRSPVAIRSVTRAACGTVVWRLGRSQRVTAVVKATFAGNAPSAVELRLAAAA